MTHLAAIGLSLCALPFLALIGCGSDDGSRDPEPLLRGTLAYVVFECIVEPEVVSTRWELRVRKGVGEPVAVAKYDLTQAPNAPTAIGIELSPSCKFLGTTRFGPGQVAGGGPFQQVAVSPDGSRVAFTLTEQFFAGDPPPDRLPPEDEGIFVVDVDVSQFPRRIGPAPGVASFSVDPLTVSPFAGFNFSPDGRLLVYVDWGPGPDGEDALQIWTREVVTGQPTQVTELPTGPRVLTPNGDSDAPPTCCASFLDSETIQFASTVRLNEPPEPRLRAPFTIKPNGEELEMARRHPVASEAPQLGDSFFITGKRPSVGVLDLASGSVNEITCPLTRNIVSAFLVGSTRTEVFYFDGENVLQLTNLRLNFTRDAFLGTDGSRAFFAAAPSRVARPPEGWTIIDEGHRFAPSEWLVSGGKLRQLSNIFGGSEENTSPVKSGSFAVANTSMSTSNYRFAVTLEPTDDDALGVMVRYRDADNYYRFAMDRERRYRRLTKKVDGVVTILAEDDFAYELNEVYALSLTVADDRLRVVLNDELVFDVSDAELETGGIALYTWEHSGAIFDDVLVTDLGASGDNVLFSDDFEVDGGLVSTNPTGNCQLFSIDVGGSDLRQLTHFDDDGYSTSGCQASSTPGCGCGISGPYQDPRTEALVFYSSCDPFGRNLNGGEIFAIRKDGSDLRQLTETKGFDDGPVLDDDSFVVELPGPYAYSAKHPGGDIR